MAQNLVDDLEGQGSREACAGTRGAVMPAFLCLGGEWGMEWSGGSWGPVLTCAHCVVEMVRVVKLAEPLSVPGSISPECCEMVLLSSVAQQSRALC